MLSPSRINQKGLRSNDSDNGSNNKQMTIEINEEERLFDDVCESGDADVEDLVASAKKDEDVKKSYDMALRKFFSKQHPTLLLGMLFGIVLTITNIRKRKTSSTFMNFVWRAIKSTTIFLLGALVHDIRIHWYTGLSSYMNMICAFIRFNDAQLWAVEDDPTRSLQHEIELSRKSFEFFMQLIPYPSVLEVDKFVRSRTIGHQIPVKIFRPHGTIDEKLPIIMFLHGGGMVAGSIKSHAPLCAKLAHRVHAVVVSVDYRLAPEHRYPKAHHDCYDVLEFIGGNMISYEEKVKLVGGEFDEARFALAGDSAGATLAGCVAIEAKQRNINICHQLLVYPCAVAYGINPTCPANTVTKSFAAAYHGPLLSNRAVIFYTDLLFGNDRATTITSSLMATHRYKLEGIAPATIITARHDPLHDEGLLYAKYLTTLKVPVTYNSYNSIHGFWGLPIFDYGEEAFNFSVKQLRIAFAKNAMEELYDSARNTGTLKLGS